MPEGEGEKKQPNQNAGFIVSLGLLAISPLFFILPFALGTGPNPGGNTAQQAVDTTDPVIAAALDKLRAFSSVSTFLQDPSFLDAYETSLVTLRARVAGSTDTTSALVDALEAEQEVNDVSILSDEAAPAEEETQVFAANNGGSRAEILANIDKQLAIIPKLRASPPKTELEALLNELFSLRNALVPLVEGLRGGGNVPRLYQSGDRTIIKGSSSISTSGCGIVSLVMVLQSYGVAVDVDGIIPEVNRVGMYTPGSGSNAALIPVVARKYGMEAVGEFRGYMSISESQWSRIVEFLKSGVPVITSGKGNRNTTPYSRNGHFVVLTGITSDGKVQVNDPRRSLDGRVFDEAIIKKYARSYVVLKPSGS